MGKRAPVQFSLVYSCVFLFKVAYLHANTHLSIVCTVCVCLWERENSLNQKPSVNLRGVVGSLAYPRYKNVSNKQPSLYRTVGLFHEHCTLLKRS